MTKHKKLTTEDLDICEALWENGTVILYKADGNTVRLKESKD